MMLHIGCPNLPQYHYHCVIMGVKSTVGENVDETLTYSIWGIPLKKEF